MAGTNQQAAQDFLGGLFSDLVDESRRLTLWSAKTKQTEFCASVEYAASTACEMSEKGHDIYFGVALQPVAVKGRGNASSALGIGGLWADVDYAAEGRSKENLPPTAEAALACIEQMPLKFSTLVDSGRGFHAWWNFNEPWMFSTPEEQRDAALSVAGWQQMLRSIMEERDWALDSTHDLARVLRVPGTLNIKRECGIEVYENGGPLYNPDDFDTWAGMAKEKVQRTNISVDGLVFSEAAEPPGVKLTAMLDFEPKFKATWLRKRREFPSQSEYDMALATMAAGAGWSRQEIVNLLISHRRQGGQDLHLTQNKAKYWELTLGAAIKDKAAQDAFEDMQARTAAIESGEELDEHKPAIVSDLSAQLGFDVVRITKYLGDPPEYTMEISGGEPISLGGVETLLVQGRFAAKVAASRNERMNDIPKARWKSVSSNLLKIAEPVDLGVDSHPKEQTKEWLSSYLEDRRPVETSEEGCKKRQPFYDARGRVNLFSDPFRRWLYINRNLNLNMFDLAKRMREIGYEQGYVSYTDKGGKATSRYVWREEG